MESGAIQESVHSGLPQPALGRALQWLFGRLVEARRPVDSSLRTGDKPGPRWSRSRGDDSHAVKNDRFSDEERRGVHRAIYERRDVRSHFLSDPVPDDVLGRILDAAHHAPSVGFMQPWASW